ncbi:Gmad2 immunoglobulin-like domain-containing protein [Shimazuella kribbensis]|uniref:Gmad2 immunoglobulin-like domain-containing protein n=1 Tax=Shimazuella kribbensis TaxID=139808 RepID=UPI0003F949B6|nr:Gmad2 immunoglobulin-like domain-containing protein [Shimazuella kribbensis]
MKRITSFVLAMVLSAALVFVPNLVEAKQTKVQQTYQVTGQARIWEATYQFRVKEGKKELVKGYGTASMGAPEWGDFKETIKVTRTKGSKLTLELFEESMEDGSEINKLIIPLDQIKGKVYQNNAFRNVKVSLK